MIHNVAIALNQFCIVLGSCFSFDLYMMGYTDFVFYVDRIILISITNVNIHVQCVLDSFVSLKDKLIRCNVLICFQSSSSDSVGIKVKRWISVFG